MTRSLSVPTLVTGGTGFVGAAVVGHLIEAGASVRVLCRQSSQSDLLQPYLSRFEQVQGDVTDPGSLSDAMNGIEHVFHLAGFVGFGGRADREKLYDINVRGTANVVNAALRMGISRLVLTSSVSALGRPKQNDRIIDESVEWQSSPFNTVYGWSKYQAELEIHRGIAEGLDAVIVNPSLIFGEGRSGENTHVILENIKKQKLPANASGGTNVVDVIDVAQGHLLALMRGETGKRYFFGAENLSWQVIIKTFADAFGVKPPRFTLNYRAAMSLAYAAEGWAKLTRTHPLITRETARISSRFPHYSNARAKIELGCSFRPLVETAQRLADNSFSTNV